MLYRIFVISVATFSLWLGASSSTYARSKVPISTKADSLSLMQAGDPVYCFTDHCVGKLVLSVANNGAFGNATAGPSVTDCFTGEQLILCEYPKGSNTRYLFEGGFWIGAVVGRDTLVSIGTDGWGIQSEFTPYEDGFGAIEKRSINGDNAYFSRDAVSEEDFVFVYSDSAIGSLPPDYFGKPYKPLNVEVTQSSYAWSYSYLEDFVLFDYKIRNIGSDVLQEVYMGIFVDGDVFFGDGYYVGDQQLDDICGFLHHMPSTYMNCEFEDTVNIAWIADNDGDPIDGRYVEQSVPHVIGARIVRTPADSLDVSFNWWITNRDVRLDFGPREKERVGLWPEPFRDFGIGGLGTPVGDANAYYQLKNQEFDYDQIYTGVITGTDPLWLEPNQELASDFGDGYDTRFLLSFGPFDIYPGETLPLSFAFVAGENFHTDPDNILNLPERPDLFYRNIDFSDLATNAAWAAKVYDNPGVDTDGDGYAGKVRACCNDGRETSLYSIDSLDGLEWYDPARCRVIAYEGDGVPDFRGASPPPGPEFWLTANRGSIHVRINGIRSETAKDLFTGVPDFEGYRVYIGRDERESSYSAVASWDKEDYNKFVLVGSAYMLFDLPFTMDSLRCLYGLSCGDTLFDPMIYTKDHPYFHPDHSDSVFYFVRQDYNTSEFGVGTPIIKTYPDQPYPSSLNPDSASADELTEDGYFKYFEYEIDIDGLLQSVPYWINVTAFDFGSPEVGLSALESSVTQGAKTAYADVMVDDVSSDDLKVFVYPNPYRVDAEYRDTGYEGRTDNDRPDCRLRAINFCNLPARCTIRIYTLDGDLVRELDHDRDPSDPTATHDSWNLITRNTQMVASGLYYWTVEAEDGTAQMGKLVIIL